MAYGDEWTTTALLASIRRRACFPTGDEAWSDEDILALATEAMRDYILPVIREVREEFLVGTHDVTVAVGTTGYRLPQRFAAEAIRVVLMSDGLGGFVPMTRVEPENARKLQIGFYLEDDKLVLSWTPTQATTVRLKYYMRPSKLVVASEALTIANNPGGGTDATVSDASNTAGIATGAVDIVSHVPGFRILDMDALVSSVASFPDITFQAALAADVTAGDFICQPGESPVPQIPAELHPLLAQRTAVKMGEGQSPTEGYTNALRELGEMEKRARSMFAERTEGNPRFVHNFHAPGWGKSTIRRQTGGN